MSERAYHRELVDIYRRAAHIWRTVKPYSGDDEALRLHTNEARWYANEALDDVVTALYERNNDTRALWFNQALTDYIEATIHTSKIVKQQAASDGAKE